MIQIAFAGRNRPLRYDIAAMMELERVTGKPTGDIMREHLSLSFTVLACVLWAGLIDDDNKLTVKGVSKALQAYVDLPGADLAALRKAINDALAESSWFKQINGSEDEPAEKDEDDHQGKAFPARMTG